MSLSSNQNKLLAQVREALQENPVKTDEVPEETVRLLDELWEGFKELADFDNLQEADLAALGSFAQFAALAVELDDAQVKPLMLAFLNSLMVKPLS